MATKTTHDELARARREAADAQARANALAAAAAAAEQKAEAEKQARRRDWAELTLASYDTDLAEVLAAHDQTARAFRDAAPTPNAPAAYLAWMATKSALYVCHSRATSAAGILGKRPPASHAHLQEQVRFADAMHQALSWHAAQQRGDLEDAWHAELAAVDAGV